MVPHIAYMSIMIVAVRAQWSFFRVFVEHNARKTVKNLKIVGVFLAKLTFSALKIINFIEKKI